jgi:hypothetical protein
MRSTLNKRPDALVAKTWRRSAVQTMNPMREKAARWARREDDLLRFLVDSGCTIDLVAETLDRRPEDIRRRGYVLGLPLKWFKRAMA